jgi:hypothetical protein
LTIGSDAEHTLLVQVLSGADAAPTQKGHITLAGELTGTAALPTITSTHSGSAHHAAITLKTGHDAALTLSGQELDLADVLTPTEHTNIGSGSPHHAAVTLATGGDTLLGLSGQALDLDTQAANLGLFGPVSGDPAAPTFRALANADFPATLNPTLAGLGATPIVTSYAGPHAIGGAADSSIQLWLRGSLVASSGPAALYISTNITPGGTNQGAEAMLLNPTINMVAGQTHTRFMSLQLVAPTIVAASGATVTEATTLRINSAPTAGVSNYAINVVAGASKFGALTASLPIITDSDKVLASLAYTGATSFRKNLGLETDDSPTFNQGNFTTLHTTTILADHIGEHASAHTVVFDNTVLLPAVTNIRGTNPTVYIGTNSDPETATLSLGYQAIPSFALKYTTTDAVSYIDMLYVPVNGTPYGDLNIRTKNPSSVSTSRIYIVAYTGKVGFGGNTAPAEVVDVIGNLNATGVLKIDDVQVVSNQVVDATIDNSIEAAFTTLYPLASALLNGIRTAQKTHGLMAAS